MREKLIEMLKKSFEEQSAKRGILTAPHTADYLIANGVSLRPRGEWIHREYDESDDSDEYYYCSECHAIALSEFGRYTFVRSDFCPNCGADMRGDNDGT